MEYQQLSITDIIIEPVKNDGKFKTKQYFLSKINREYYNDFKDSFDKITSWLQYKVHCGDFLEQLGNRDFATITVEDIENYVDNYKGSKQTKANCRSHVRSMMIYIVKNNVGGASSRVDKKMLIYLI